MLKICVISHTYISQIRASWLKELCNDFEVHVIVPEKYYHLLAEEIADFQKHDLIPYEYHTLPLKFPIGFKGSTKFILRGLFKKIIKIQPDIIYVENELHSLLVLQSIFISKLLKKKNKIGFFSWVNLRAPFLKEIFFIISRLCLLPLIDFVVAGNQENKMIMQKYLRARNEILILPQYGIDMQVFKKLNIETIFETKERYGIPSDKFIIGYVGRFVKEKGINTLLESLKGISCNNKNLHFCFIGKGPEKNKIDEEMVNLSYSIKEAVPLNEIPNIMGVFDVLVLPSIDTPIWKEQFGRVLVEAMSCSVVVVGSDSGAIPEVIGIDELIFRQNNSNELINILNILIHDKDKRTTLKNNLHERVNNFYSNKAIANKFREFIFSLTKQA